MMNENGFITSSVDHLYTILFGKVPEQEVAPPSIIPFPVSFPSSESTSCCLGKGSSVHPTHNLLLRPGSRCSDGGGVTANFEYFFFCCFIMLKLNFFVKRVFTVLKICGDTERCVFSCTIICSNYLNCLRSS